MTVEKRSGLANQLEHADWDWLTLSCDQWQNTRQKSISSVLSEVQRHPLQ